MILPWQGDLAHMRATADYTFDENVADAMKLSSVFDCIATFRRPVIALVKGNTFGGGLGLLSSCDMAYGVEGTQCVVPSSASHVSQHSAIRHVNTLDSCDFLSAAHV